MSTTYRASDYMDHPDALSMARQDGGEATPTAAALYVTMWDADKHGDMGNTYEVNPKEGTVTRLSGKEIAYESPTLDHADVYTSEDVRVAISEASTNGMPGYYHVFDSAEFLEPRNYRFHLQDFVEGDEHEEPRTFRFQSVPIECMRSEDDEFYEVEPMGAPYGWALLAGAVSE